ADLLHLLRAAVPARELAAVDEVRIERVGDGVAVFLDRGGMPLAVGDAAVVAARLHARRAALLLAAADAVGEGVVGVDVKHLRGRLVVPGAPRLAAVHGDDGSLVGADEDDLRVVRIDPDAVVVVPPSVDLWTPLPGPVKTPFSQGPMRCSHNAA